MVTIGRGVSKKRISSDFFQLALLLTLINNEFSFFNNGLYNGISTSSYESSTGGGESTLSWLIGSPPHYLRRNEEDFWNISSEEESITRTEEILADLRALDYVRYSELPRELAKAPNYFQDITVYPYTFGSRNETAGDELNDLQQRLSELVSSVPSPPLQFLHGFSEEDVHELSFLDEMDELSEVSGKEVERVERELYETELSYLALLQAEQNELESEGQGPNFRLLSNSFSFNSAATNSCCTNFIDESESLFGIDPNALHRNEESEEEEREESRGRKWSGASFSSNSSHHEPAINSNPSPSSPSTSEDIKDADSGIFDFLGEISSPESSHSISRPPSHLDAELSDSCLVDGEEESGGEEENLSEMIQTAPIHPSARPTSHTGQPRPFQVHGRMGGGLGSQLQGYQELASLLSLGMPHGDMGSSNVSSSMSLPFSAHHHYPHPLHHPLYHHPHSSSSSSSSSTPPNYSPYLPPHPHPHSIEGGGGGRQLSQLSLLHPTSSSGSDIHGSSHHLYPHPPHPHHPPTTSTTMGPPPSLGSAVASSIHLTNNSDPMSYPSYNKMIDSLQSHDMLYCSNNGSANVNGGSEINNTTDGFFSSILNEDDFQIMDMAMNEGLYTMKPLDNSSSGVGPCPPLPPPLSESSLNLLGGGGGVSEDRMEASSDSAVSSMGSERVPQLPDSDWTASPDFTPSLDYSSKVRGGNGYDFYGKNESNVRVIVPVAQKKHQMFGKRYLQEQGTSSSSSSLNSYGPHFQHSLDSLDMKYSSSLDFNRHILDGVANNHTYALPLPDMSSRSQIQQQDVRSHRNSSKEKSSKMCKEFSRSEEAHLSRDEKRARTLGLPLTTDEIINLPMDEFNERLSKYDLTETQLSLIRDIRRRGKNKVAAQNCRKRKLDQILQLADEVERIRERKQNLLREHDGLISRRNHLKDKYAMLYRHVFQALRDPDGNPLSPYEFSLQQAADGNIIIVPKRGSNTNSAQQHLTPSHQAQNGQPNGLIDSELPSSSRTHRTNNISKSKDELKKDPPS